MILPQSPPVGMDGDAAGYLQKLWSLLFHRDLDGVLQWLPKLDWLSRLQRLRAAAEASWSCGAAVLSCRTSLGSAHESP